VKKTQPPKGFSERDEDKPRPGGTEWRSEHGISTDVWAARGAWWYSWQDVEGVKDAFRPFLPRTRLGTVSKIVNQSSGLVMPKHAPPGLLPVPPQLRPDIEVFTDRRGTWHFHGATGDGWPLFPAEAGSRAGKPLPRALVLSGDTLEAHLGKSRNTRYDPVTGEGDHRGVDVEGVHFHAPRSAKYVLLGDNQRFDLHPWALERLAKAERVFFVLEGALKNDAVLSAGEAVFSVPSVTLWDPTELREFVRTFLQDKTVYVVPDADWFHNPAVDRQAIYVREIIRGQGLQAHIAAPPTDGLESGIKGVDDFLGVGGGVIDGLVVRGKEAPHDRIAAWGLTKPYSDSSVKALRGLSLHADGEGRIYVPVGTLAKVVGTTNYSRVVPLLDRISDAIEIDGDLEILTVERTNPKTQKVHRISEWKVRPRITVRPEFRAEESVCTIDEL